jgi:hypothetical protein
MKDYILFSAVYLELVMLTFLSLLVLFPRGIWCHSTANASTSATGRFNASSAITRKLSVAKVSKDKYLPAIYAVCPILETYYQFTNNYEIQ